jgi:hypothetical protein
MALVRAAASRLRQVVCCALKMLGHPLVSERSQEHRSSGFSIAHIFGNCADFLGKAVEQSNSPPNFGHREGHTGTPLLNATGYPRTITVNGRQRQNVPYRLQPSARSFHLGCAHLGSHHPELVGGFNVSNVCGFAVKRELIKKAPSIYRRPQPRPQEDDQRAVACQVADLLAAIARYRKTGEAPPRLGSRLSRRVQRILDRT